MFRFASPYFLILLLLIPLMIHQRRRRGAPMLAGSDARAAEVPPSPVLKIRWLTPLLCYLALALAVTALARPQWGTRKTTIKTTGINIVLALDLSESMAALDFRLRGDMVNRLEAVKYVVEEFIAHRSGDRIAVVVFGDQAYTQLPLTRDYHTITAILDRLQIGAAGRSTAMGDAVGISLKRLKDVKSKSNIIILLTDGRSNSGELEPAVAADIAREQGVKIYTIGVGSRGKVPFVINDPVFGQRTVYQQVDLDEAALKQMAERTGGKYFRAQDMEGLEKIYDDIDSLEKTDVKMDTFADYAEIYIYFLMPALALLALWIVLINTRFLQVP
jgi:Ca-activated chloride channel family protein